MTHRSWLFVPGDSPRKMEKALQSGADALILDLEDAVAPADKARARELVAAFLAQPAEIARFVRVNALDTGLTESDVAATAGLGLQGYVLPKCEGPDDIATLAALMDHHKGEPDLGILAIATETARAVRRLMREDWSHPRLHALTWGGEDLSADLGASRNRDDRGGYLGPFQLARDLTLFAAAEAGVAAIDAVFTDFSDADGLSSETAAACALGFAGKMAIHPAQVSVIHQALRPSTEELDWARNVLDSFAVSESGVTRLGNLMLDRPHLIKAQRILARERLN